MRVSSIEFRGFSIAQTLPKTSKTQNLPIALEVEISSQSLIGPNSRATKDGRPTRVSMHGGTSQRAAAMGKGIFARYLRYQQIDSKPYSLTIASSEWRRLPV